MVLVLATWSAFSLGCNKDQKDSSKPSPAASASAALGDDNGPRFIKVQCNKPAIFKHMDASNGGATSQAAFDLFIATHRAKNKDEGFPEASAFKRRGANDNPMYYAMKGDRVIAQVEILPNLSGGGYYVEMYEVCPTGD